MKRGQSGLAFILFMVWGLLGHHAQGSTNQSILLVVGKIKNAVYVSDPDWAKGRCSLLHRILESAQGSPLETACISYSDDPETQQKITDAQNSSTYRFEFEFLTQADGSIRFTILNLHPEDDTDFEKTSYTINPAENGTQLMGIQKFARHFFSFDGTRGDFKKYLLNQGLYDSETIKSDDHGGFIDPSTQKPLELNDAYIRFKNESPKHTHYLRAAIEIGAFIGIGWYHYQTTPGLQDNQFSNSYWGALSYRFKTFDVIRFDNNRFGLNQETHPKVGALYYDTCRVNNIDRMACFLYTFASSSFWEYIVEAREVVSINDEIYTSFGGAIIGEVLFQYRNLFLSTNGNPVYRLLAAFPEGLALVNRLFDRNIITPKNLDTDKYGFPTDIWHQFSLDLEANREKQKGFLFDGEIINIPTYGKPGKVSKVYGATPISELLIGKMGGPEAYSDLVFYVKAALEGYYKQSIEQKGDQLDGYSFFAGPSVAYNIEEQHSKEFSNMMADLNLLGPTLDLNVYTHGFKIHCVLNVSGDIAAISSFALDEYKENHSILNTKDVLANNGYYFAYGGTEESKVTVSRGKLEAGASTAFHHFESIDVRDTFVERETNNFHLRDERSRVDAWVSYLPSCCNTKLTIGVEQQQYGGQIKDTFVGRKDNRLYSKITFLF